MKKAICIILVAAMMLGFLGMLGLEVFAADYQIDFDTLKQNGGVTQVEIQTPDYQVGQEIPSPQDISISVQGGAYVKEVIGFVDVTQGNDHPVTGQFQAGQRYWLVVKLAAPEGYVFNDPTINADREFVWGGNGDTEISVDLLYEFPENSNLQIVDNLVLELNDPALGMEINQLSATVLEGNAIAMPVQVCDVDTGMPVEEPTLLDNKYYAIWYSFMPMDGYQFNEDWINVDVVDCDFALQWSHGPESLVFCREFTTCDPIEKVEVTISGATVGGRFDQVTVSVPEGKNYTLKGFEVYGEGEVFDENEEYDVVYELAAAEGYAFTYDTRVVVNGEERWFNVEKAGKLAFGYHSVGFRVNEVYLYDLPHKLTEGPVFGEDEVRCSSQAQVLDAKWVDENKQPVDAWETGKVYYLAVTLEGKDGRKFHEYRLDVNVEGREYRYERISETTAVIYVKYQLLPDAGDVAVTVKGLEEGKKVSDIKVTATGKVKVSNWQLFKIVYDENGYYDNQLVESGKIEKGCRYYVSVELKADEGYSIGEGRYTINGAVGDVGYSEDMLYLSYGFHTCKVITSVAPTLTTPAVGKDAPALKAESKANYTVSYEWRDVTDDYKLVTGKLEKGHAYELYATLQPKDGYVFDGEYTFKLGGKTVEAYGQSGSLGMDFYVRYSFMDIIEKVELPAIPDKITLGQELPTSFTVEGKNYTLEANWSRYNGGDGFEVTKVECNDIYSLELHIVAKSGYEFDSEKTKVYVGNKQVVSPFLYVYDTSIDYFTVYTVGMELITKIELTVSKLEAGKLPTISVSDSANYVLAEDAWAQGNQSGFDEDMEGVEIVEALANGKYTFMGVMLTPKDGYAISENVEFYVNGKKVEPTVEVQQYVLSVAYLPMGKLGELTKLATPKATVSGETISWKEIAGAEAYEIYRATSKSGKYALVDTVTELSWQDDVAAGKTYYYKVKAIYDASNSKNSALSSAATVNYKLSATTVGVAMDKALGKAMLSWDAVEGAKSYEIWRATSESGKYTRVATNKASVLTYTDKYASVGKAYFYKIKVVASKSTYNSEYSNIVSATAVCAQAKLTVKQDAATGKPVISWAKVDGAQNYWLLRREDGSDMSFEIISRQTAVSFTDKTAEVGKVYEYTMQVIGKEPELDSEFSVSVTAPCGLAKPVVKGTITDQGKPQLTWNAVEGAVKYEVYRSTKSNKGYTLLGETASTMVDDVSVAAGKTYYYQVIAVGQSGKSVASSYVKLTGKCATPMIHVENAASGKPLVSWNKIEGAKSYTIYRASSENGKYSKAGTSKTLTFEDKKASAGKVYFYKVVANGSKSSYNSGYSYAMSCNVLLAAPKVKVTYNAQGIPTISWSKVSGAKQYLIVYQTGFMGSGGNGCTACEDCDICEYYECPGCDCEGCICNNPFGSATGVYTTKTSYTFSDLQVGEMGWVEVIAVAANESCNSQVAEASIECKPATPKPKGKVGASGKPVLTWNHCQDTIIYEVYRSTKSGKGYELIGQVDLMQDDMEPAAVQTYEDTTAVKGKTYYYKIVAKGWWTESAMSSYVKVKSK